MTSKINTKKPQFKVQDYFAGCLLPGRLTIGFMDAMWRWLGVCAFVVSFTACAGSTPMSTVALPGNQTYCISTRSTAAFLANLKKSVVDYGPHKRHVIAGNGAICDLTRFYIYSVSWTTKDGSTQFFEFDTEKLMEKFFKDNPSVKNMGQFTRSPRISVEYQPERVQISYSISQYAEGGVDEKGNLIKPAVVTTFPLLNQSITPASSTRTN